MQSIPFLATGLTRTLSKKEVDEQANELWLPMYLIMNGIPEKYVEHATKDGLSILEKIVVMKKTSSEVVSDAVTNKAGIGMAFGS